MGNGGVAASTPQWLIDLKAVAAAMRERRERPAGKPAGRWLGDFLDRDTPSGLLPAEEKLLFAAAAGEACVLQSRTARLWAAFDGWRKTIPKAEVPVEEDFAQAMAKFLGSAPGAVQEVIHDATFHAFLDAGLPEGWEPQNAEETQKLATAQKVYFARLEKEANPAKTIREARTGDPFFLLAVNTVIEALTPPPGKPVELQDKWFSPLLRGGLLKLSAETQEEIDAQPRVLRGFFAELVRHVKTAPGTDQAYLAKLKTDPTVLRPYFDAAFERYEREAWRRVDPHDFEVRLRAGFLRFLSLGGDDAAPVHERRLELHGGYIGEDLDLSGCTIPQPLLFFRSYFGGQITLNDAITKSLDFQRSRVRSVTAESARIQGGVFLHNGFCSASGVSFPYATIEGRLLCDESTFHSGGKSAMNFSGARVSGDAVLSDGFLGEGGVYFYGARIGGDLSCSGGTFCNRTEDGLGIALGCPGSEISGNVFLSDGFRSEGLVYFAGVKVGGRLYCTEGIFINRTPDGTGTALDFQNAEINKAVSLDRFLAEGEAGFYGAHIKGNFECYGGRFDNAVPAQSDGSTIWSPVAANALSLYFAKIDGTLWLGPHAGDAKARAEIAGSMALGGCHAHEIIDHPSSWPSKYVTTADGKRLTASIILDGFTYDRLTGRGDYDTGTRKRWLDRQPKAHLGENFRPQPFEQLIKVYREMGHERHAREIAKFRERRRYQSRFIKLWHGWRDRPGLARRIFGGSVFGAALDWLAWPFAILARALSRSLRSILLALEWFIIGAGTAYGYGYSRLVGFLLALWLAGGLFYATAADQGAFAPSNPVIYLNKELEAKCGKNWTDCTGAPPGLPSFSPFVYSLDIMLPVLDLGQKHDWQPIDRPGKGHAATVHLVQNQRSALFRNSRDELGGAAAERGHARQPCAGAHAFELGCAGPSHRDLVGAHQEGLTARRAAKKPSMPPAWNGSVRSIPAGVTHSGGMLSSLAWIGTSITSRRAASRRSIWASPSSASSEQVLKTSWPPGLSRLSAWRRSRACTAESAAISASVLR
jgi:hypothetical protein